MRRLVVVVLFVTAFAVACFVDAPVADAVRSSGLAGRVRGSVWAEGVKFFGTFWYAVVAAGGFLVFSWVEHSGVQTAKTQATDDAVAVGERSSEHPARSRWRGPAGVLLAAAVSGLNVIPKWIFGQIRPFKPDGTTTPQPFDLHWFSHGIAGLFHESDLAFPSGHACLSAAVGSAVALARPRLLILVAAIAVVVGIERVIENAHYVDDVIAGWAFGWGSAVVAGWIDPVRPTSRARRVLPP
jgi:membrane-associated phospholipid phosphatase